MLYSAKKILKFFYLKAKYLGKRVSFEGNCSIGIKAQLEGLNKIGKNTIFEGFLGFGSYIGANCSINGRIGRYCSIASNVNVIYATHPIKDFVSTNPVFYSLFKQNGDTFTSIQLFNEYLFADNENDYPVVVGNDVWIGHGTTLIGGITIGDGAVILANSTVTKNVPAYSIVGGVPAKFVRTRFDEETINFLLEVQWWNKSEAWLRSHVDIFNNIDEFKKYFK